MVNQGKGDKRDAFLPGTGSSGRDAMGIRYTVASVTTIELESAIYFGTFYLSILRHHKGGGNRRWRRKPSVTSGDAPECPEPLTYRCLVGRQGFALR